MGWLRTTHIVQDLKKNTKRAAQSTVRQNKSGPNQQQKQNSKNDKKKENIVMAPTAQSSQYQNAGPAFSYSSKGDGSVRIRHREYIRDIAAANANFAVASIPINPGILETFPWLHSIALSYESYLFNSLSFEFETSGVTTDRGTILMAIDFDAADSPPVTKQDMMAMNGATRSSVWSHQTCTASIKDLRKFGVQRYVRNLAPLVNQDIKTYDVGNFFIATQGTGNLTCGELYVTYDITLHTPQSPVQSITYGLDAYADSNNAVASGTPLGTSFDIKRGGFNLQWRTTNSFYVRTPGEYLLDIEYFGDGFNSDTLFTVAGLNGAAVTAVYPVPLCNTTNPGIQMARLYFLTVVTTEAYCQVSLGGNPQTYQIRIAPYLSQLG